MPGLRSSAPVPHELPNGQSLPSVRCDVVLKPAIDGVVRKVESPRPARAAHQEPGSSWSLLAAPGLKRLLCVNWVLSACWDAHSFVVPVLGHARGLSASSIGVILGSFAVAATLVRLAISRWADHLDEKQALHRAVAFRRFRAADVRSILAVGTGTPQPRPAGDALILDLPVVPTRSLKPHRIPTPATARPRAEKYFPSGSSFNAARPAITHSELTTAPSQPVCSRSVGDGT